MLFCAHLETGLAPDVPLACAALPQALLGLCRGRRCSSLSPAKAVFFVGMILCAGRISSVCCHHEE